jgi:hypothetical protein
LYPNGPFYFGPKGVAQTEFIQLNPNLISQLFEFCGQKGGKVVVVRGAMADKDCILAHGCFTAFFGKGLFEGKRSGRFSSIVE